MSRLEAVLLEIGNKVLDLLKGISATVPHETEFWAAIAGAVAGGLIAFIVQMIALRAANEQRQADDKRNQQALGYSLLFKMMRIYSNFNNIHRYIEECFEEAAKLGKIEEPAPWQILLPLATVPDPVHFSADEMGMLLGQKDSDVFNSVLSMDAIHNNLMGTIKFLNDKRMALTERLAAEQMEGNVASGVLREDQIAPLRPKIFEVNDLTEKVRARAKADFEESEDVLARLDKGLREKLGLTHRLESKVKRKAAGAD